MCIIRNFLKLSCTSRSRSHDPCQVKYAQGFLSDKKILSKNIKQFSGYFMICETTIPAGVVRTLTTLNHQVFRTYGSITVPFSKNSFIIVLT